MKYYVIDLEEWDITECLTREEADKQAAELYYAGSDELYLWDYDAGTITPYNEAQLDELCVALNKEGGQQ
jgi:hypothetical protein